MRASRAPRTHAFTLMEMLVVIAIIAVVAGLVVGLAGVAGESSKIKRTQVELGKVTSLIDSYKSKVGTYPPDHPSNPDVNSLLYELAGAQRNGPVNDPTYDTPFGSIQSNQIWSTYGTNGFVNAKDPGSDDSQIYRILKDLHKDQSATVAGHLSLVIPVDGPNGKPNPWKYLVGDHATNNPSTYDLWVDIVVRGKTNRIGNWKN